MVNINFFEKKKKNITPFLISVIAVLLFGLLGGYFWWMTESIKTDTSRNRDQISQQADEITELQRINLIGNQVSTLVNQRDTLMQNQFPLDDLYHDVLEQIPSQASASVERFFFTITGTVQLEIVFDNDQHVVDMQRNLVNLPYVTSVTLETIDINDTAYATQFTLMIDRTQVSEVFSDDN
jgi:cell division protein FtsB